MSCPLLSFLDPMASPPSRTERVSSTLNLGHKTFRRGRDRSTVFPFYLLNPQEALCLNIPSRCRCHLPEGPLMKPSRTFCWHLSGGTGRCACQAVMCPDMRPGPEQSCKAAEPGQGLRPRALTPALCPPSVIREGKARVGPGVTRGCRKTRDASR